MLEKIQKIASMVQLHLKCNPEIAIILGSGLSHLSDKIDVKSSIPYSKIPDFPISTVEGHEGCFISGEFAGKEVIAMKGRFHYYEGYTMDQITLPVRIMKFLGVKYLIISNAAGGMNSKFNVGDIMLIEDHINLMGTNPLIGKNINELGPRFLDMSSVYDRELINLAKKASVESGIPLRSGIYAAVSGPTYETPAEYKYIRLIGADAVGMSTIPEAIIAHHMGIKILAMSVITDLAYEGHISSISHDEVLMAAMAVEPSVTKIIQSVLKNLSE